MPPFCGRGESSLRQVAKVRRIELNQGAEELQGHRRVGAARRRAGVRAGSDAGIGDVAAVAIVVEARGAARTRSRCPCPWRCWRTGPRASAPLRRGRCRPGTARCTEQNGRALVIRVARQERVALASRGFEVTAVIVALRLVEERVGAIILFAEDLVEIEATATGRHGESEQRQHDDVPDKATAHGCLLRLLSKKDDVFVRIGTYIVPWTFFG